MKVTTLALSLMISTVSFAGSSPCENIAKFGAIRAYKAQNGTVQGSEGIEYNSKLVGKWNDIYDYVVTIADNNDEGEAWEIDYSVRTRLAAPKCRIESVKKINVR